ncbi:MAG TPA: hypothetical protein PKM73_16200 [Verrucomicrobiota bacterium]|nr:hypothetical protein [Verrucomicrobiota bacterium]HNU52480.1 hypothetical protein [Verrucomicrobiota bacterium]
MTNRIFLLTLALGIALAASAAAQQHRATRLGHPSTRFAPPLKTPEDLRRLLQDERMKADITSILDQAGWTGNVDDLRRAAGTAPIAEVKVPTGTVLPFMSSRKDGKPVTLINVLWAGQEAIDAYAFFFSSKGRRYRCLTPKACSNFLVEDLGPEPPSLVLTKAIPADVSRCDPIDVKILVRNNSHVPLTRVTVTDTLPEGMSTLDDQTALNLDAGNLAPGAGMEFAFKVKAAAEGAYVNRAQAACAEGATAEAAAQTTVHAPRLALDCVAPAEALPGRPVRTCLSVTNRGDALDPRVAVTLVKPAGAAFESATEGGVLDGERVVWELGPLGAGAGRTLCAAFIASQPAALGFSATAEGGCAEPVQTACSTRVSGVPGILLEVVDVEDPIEVGKEVTYLITVTNQGSMPLTRICLTCALPGGQEYVSGTGATPVQAQNRTLVMQPLPSLEPRATATWRVTAKALQVGDTRFKVELTGDQFPRPVEEYEATQQY